MKKLALAALLLSLAVSTRPARGADSPDGGDGDAGFMGGCFMKPTARMEEPVEPSEEQKRWAQEQTLAAGHQK